MKRVAILGLGLMGGSLGVALKRRGLADRVTAYARRDETRAYALDHGMVDDAFDDPEAAVRGADLTVVCVPILATPGLVERCRPALKPGSIVTDVGSTKAAVGRDVDVVLSGTGCVFIGSHPIAGSEQQGIQAAREELYDDAMVVVTPRSVAEMENETGRLASFWRAVGGRVHVMNAERHDEMLARTSHLPHMVAASLAAAVGRDDAWTEMTPFCGTGIRDTTRIAAGSPEVWLDILRTNRQNVVQELTEMENVVHEVLAHLQREDYEAVALFLEKARTVHETLRKGTDPLG